MRAAGTAPRAMGRERNRSMAPLARSSANPTPVVVTALAVTVRMNAGHQVVDIVDARGADRTAEHVTE
jgi:hypothetical protein